MEKLNLSGKSQHSTDDTLRGLSALFVTSDSIFIDNGAIHAKSNFEKSLTFVKSGDELTNPVEVVVFWITLKRQEGVQGYAGAMPFSIFVDETNKLAYKSLADQVNKMDKAVKAQVDVSGISPEVKDRVRAYLIRIRPDLWEHAFPDFRAAFSDS